MIVMWFVFLVSLVFADDVEGSADSVEATIVAQHPALNSGENHAPTNELGIAAPYFSILEGPSESWKNQRTSGKIRLPFLTASIGRGGTPINIEMQNLDTKSHLMNVSCTWSDTEVFAMTKNLDPGMSIQEQWVIPIVYGHYEGFSCTVKEDVRTVGARLDLWISDWDSSTTFPLLYIDTDVSRSRFSEWMLSSYLIRENEQEVHVSDGSWLPSISSGYSGLDTIIWFPEDVSLSDDKISALNNWVLIGGHLIVVSGQQQMQKQPWSSWQEARFKKNKNQTFGTSSVEYTSNIAKLQSNGLRTQYSTPMSKRAEGTQWDSYNAGRGTLTVVSGNLSLEMASSVLLSRRSNQSGLYTGYQTLDSRTKERISPEPVSNSNELVHDQYAKDELLLHPMFELTPPGVIILLGTLFFIILGPFNILFPRNRLHMLWRTPLLGFLGVFIVIVSNWALSSNNSLGTTMDFVLLDQRNDLLLSTQKRVFLVTSDLDESPSLLSHTQLIPIRDVSSQYPMTNLEITENDSELSRAILPRTLQSGYTWTNLLQRRGLRVNGETVFNDLGIDLEDVWVRDSNGTYWLAEEIDKNSSATLVRQTSRPPIPLWIPSIWKGWHTMYWEDIPNNTYIFHSDKLIMWDGVASSGGGVDEVDSKLSHRSTIVYGVLP